MRSLELFLFLGCHCIPQSLTASTEYLVLKIWHMPILVWLSSSCRAISTDIPDALLPPLAIGHCFQQVLRATSCIYTELLYVGSSWSPCLCSSLWRGPQEYITYELISTSPAVSRMSGLSNLDSFHDRW